MHNFNSPRKERLAALIVDFFAAFLTVMYVVVAISVVSNSQELPSWLAGPLLTILFGYPILGYFFPVYSLGCWAQGIKLVPNTGCSVEPHGRRKVMIQPMSSAEKSKRALFVAGYFVTIFLLFYLLRFVAERS